MLFMKNKLIIIGASGHGKVVADIAIKLNKWQSIAFLDDDQSIKTSMGLVVIGKTADAFTYKDETDFFVAIGSNATREKIQEKLIEQGLNVVSLIHPSAVIGIDVEIGVRIDTSVAKIATGISRHATGHTATAAIVAASAKT